MRKYIFITTEGFTFQPGSESTEPDIENMQVIGFGQGDSPRQAMRDMLEGNPYITETAFDEVLAIEILNGRAEPLSLKEYSRVI